MDILIIEPESRTITDLETILGNLGHHVVAVVCGGEEALKKAAELNPDLILMDIKLKGEMSGVEAANELLDLYNIPIVFLADFIKNCLIKSLQLPEDAMVLSKPVNQEHLEYVLTRILDNE